MSNWKKVFLLLPLMLVSSFVHAQGNGVQAYSAADAHEFDVVNLPTLVPSFIIPVINKPVGILPGNIRFESPQACREVANNVGTLYMTCGNSITSPLATLYPIVDPMIGMTLGGSVIVNGTCTTAIVTSLIGSDQLTSYSFPSTTLYYPTTCGGPSTATVTTNDGSAFTVAMQLDVSGNMPFITSLQNASGEHVSPYTGTNTTIFDSFGNSVQWLGSQGKFIDSLGATTTMSPFPGIYPNTFTYTDANGNPQTIGVTNGSPATFSPLVPTNCNGSVNTSSVTPISSINYPDGTTVGLTWQTNTNGSLTGLIKGITLRTGASVLYTYGNPVASTNCTNWYFSSLSRTDPDGTTQYTLSIVSGFTNVTVVDPGGNKTVYQFFGTPGAASGNPVNSISRYQNTGTIASPAYPQTSNSGTTHCYNTHCGVAPSYPITQVDTYEFVGSLQISHEVQTFDNYYGDLLTDSVTDEATTPNQTITHTYVYGTYVNGNCQPIANSFIHNKVCTDITTVGGTQVAEKIYTYNGSNAPGALTSVTDWLSSTLNLVTNYTPNNNGTIASKQDANGQITSYTYGSCNGLLPTASSTTVHSVALTTQTTWNCDTGLPTGTTDYNSHTTVKQYDALNRPSMFQDQNGAQTQFKYPTVTSTEVIDPLNVQSYMYTDTLGRNTLFQVRQSPTSNNYDTVGHAYGWCASCSISNFVIDSGVPCVSTLGNGCSTVAVTTSYSPIVGVLSTSDVNGGYINNVYNTNDISRTAGPAPVGENAKTIQAERDGFGRLKSLCALEATGGTACGQINGGSGVLTSATYSFGAGSYTSNVTRGSQTHTTVLDAIGRQISQTTPEGGTVTAVYDTISTANNCNIANAHSYGDLMQHNNGDGSYICYIYDGLHRITDIGNSNPPSGNTNLRNACKRYRFDSTVNEVNTPPSGYPSTGNNIIGRMFEAETDNCANPPVTVTDEWFAYDALGHMTDMWEWTNASGTYYHTTVTYNADSAVTSLSGIPGLSSLTYGVDGESRPFNAQLGSTWIVGSSSTTGVSYNAASEPTTVPFGTAGDNDVFGYEPLGKMNGYTYTVNGSLLVASVNWNPIGSLNNLNISRDDFFPTATQTCSFLYDDISRLTSDSCVHNRGVGFVGNYSYDQYDNLSKSGSITFGCAGCYNSAKNQLTAFQYDGSGNVLYDGVNTYVWSVYGKLSTTNAGQFAATCGSSGVCMTYDALGNPVQSNANGTVRQILYAPAIGRVAKMNGQTLSAAYITLPGGLDLWASAGVTWVTHPDWLQTKRFSHDLVNRTAVMDVAYSPYVDLYNVNGTSFKGDFTRDQQDILGQQLFDTPNRELSQIQGRWLSPDPANATWNAYSYPTNPNSEADPTGLDCPPDCSPTGPFDFSFDTNTGLGSVCDSYGLGCGVDPTSTYLSDALIFDAPSTTVEWYGGDNGSVSSTHYYDPDGPSRELNMHWPGIATWMGLDDANAAHAFDMGAGTIGGIETEGGNLISVFHGAPYDAEETFRKGFDPFRHSPWTTQPEPSIFVSRDIKAAENAINVDRMNTQALLDRLTNPSQYTEGFKLYDTAVIEARVPPEFLRQFPESTYIGGFRALGGRVIMSPTTEIEIIGTDSIKYFNKCLYCMTKYQRYYRITTELADPLK